MDRTLLARATDGTVAPTPGYLYLDIAKNAASSPVACSEVATYLTRRLASKNNPNIKFKCLKVLAKTAESPVTRGQFKRAVCQDPTAVSAVKEALQFRGPPDPARGDEPYVRVRDAAKEALDAIYSDTPTSTDYSASSGGLAPSYGSSPYGGAPPAGASLPSGGGPRRMEGIGNPMFKDPRLAQPHENMTLGKVASTAGETIVAMIKDPLARNVPDGPPDPRSGMPGFGSGGAYGNPPPGRSQLASSTGGQWTMASNRGPNAIGGASHQDSDYYRAQSSSSQWGQHSATAGTTGGVRGGVGGSWASGPAMGNPARPSVASQAREAAYSTPSITVNQMSNPAGSGGTAASDGTYERNLIMELCPPGGMKAEPPPDKLANFARSVPSLNPDLVCPALLDCLEDGQPWIIRAKALCVMETIVRVALEQPDDSPMNAYVDFFHACGAEIVPLAGHPRAAIKEPAKRVLKSLGIETTGAAMAAAPASRPPPPPTAAPNLLDFDEPKPAPPVVAPPAAASPAAVAAAPAVAASGSLFGGLTVQSTRDVGEAAPPAPTPETPSEGFDVVLGSTPHVAAPNSDLFGSMTIKESKPVSEAGAKETPQDSSGPVPLTGASAFGFMNDGAKPAPMETHPPPPSKEAFDPLMNMSPNSAKAVSSLPPAQMQAMAYQMMLQRQQLQMQQMQMALAMQQQGGRPMMQMSARQGSNPNVMAAHPNAAASNSFSFLDAPSRASEDKTFDFVKDAMKDENHKK